MEPWQRVTDSYWRKDADLPIGHAKAEIRKRDYVPLYDIRVEVNFAGPRLPQAMAKTALAVPGLASAQTVCNGILAELTASRYTGIDE